MKSAGKARNNGLYRHIRTSKEIIRNLLNDSFKRYNYCRVKSFCQKQGSKEKEPSDFVFNQKVLNFLFLFLLLLLW